MKTLRKEKVELIECEELPNLDGLKQGIMYYVSSKKSIFHLCLCGCGEISRLNIKDSFPDCVDGWIIHEKDPLTITPSILMGQGCRSHYIITKGVANFI